jgi:hypothetical protein
MQLLIFVVILLLNLDLSSPQRAFNQQQRRPVAPPRSNPLLDRVNELRRNENSVMNSANALKRRFNLRQLQFSRQLEQVALREATRLARQNQLTAPAFVLREKFVSYSFKYMFNVNNRVEVNKICNTNLLATFERRVLMGSAQCFVNRVNAENTRLVGFAVVKSSPSTYYVVRILTF